MGRLSSLLLVVPGLSRVMAEPPSGEAGGLLQALCRTAGTRARTREVPLHRVFAAPRPVPALAPLSYLGDTGRFPPGYCLRADPVQVSVGSGGLFLARAVLPDLEAPAAGSLADALGPVLAQVGLKLECPRPDRWYLFGERFLGPGLEPPWEAMGGNLLDAWCDPGLQRGLAELMNETQVSWHQHPENLARSAAGKAPANCLWPWGGGEPGSPPAGAWDWVAGADGDALAQGLAAAAGLRFHPATGPASLPTDGRAGLVWLPGHADSTSAALVLERDWLAPLARTWLPPRQVLLCGLDGEAWTFSARHWWQARWSRRSARQGE